MNMSHFDPPLGTGESGGFPAKELPEGGDWPQPQPSTSQLLANRSHARLRSVASKAGLHDEFDNVEGRVVKPMTMNIPFTTPGTIQLASLAPADRLAIHSAANSMNLLPKQDAKSSRQVWHQQSKDDDAARDWPATIVLDERAYLLDQGDIGIHHQTGASQTQQSHTHQPPSPHSATNGRRRKNERKAKSGIKLALLATQHPLSSRPEPAVMGGGGLLNNQLMSKLTLPSHQSRSRTEAGDKNEQSDNALYDRQDNNTFGVKEDPSIMHDLAQGEAAERALRRAKARQESILLTRIKKGELLASKLSDGLKGKAGFTLPIINPLLPPIRKIASRDGDSEKYGSSNSLDGNVSDNKALSDMNRAPDSYVHATKVYEGGVVVQGDEVPKPPGLDGTMAQWLAKEERSLKKVIGNSNSSSGVTEDELFTNAGSLVGHSSPSSSPSSSSILGLPSHAEAEYRVFMPKLLAHVRALMQYAHLTHTNMSKLKFDAAALRRRLEESETLRQTEEESRASLVQLEVSKYKESLIKEHERMLHMAVYSARDEERKKHEAIIATQGHASSSNNNGLKHSETARIRGGGGAGGGGIRRLSSSLASQDNTSDVSAWEGSGDHSDTSINSANNLFNKAGSDSTSIEERNTNRDVKPSTNLISPTSRKQGHMITLSLDGATSTPFVKEAGFVGFNPRSGYTSGQLAGQTRQGVRRGGGLSLGANGSSGNGGSGGGGPGDEPMLVGSRVGIVQPSSGVVMSGSSSSSEGVSTGAGAVGSRNELMKRQRQSSSETTGGISDDPVGHNSSRRRPQDESETEKSDSFGNRSSTLVHTSRTRGKSRISSSSTSSSGSTPSTGNTSSSTSSSPNRKSSMRRSISPKARKSLTSSISNASQRGSRSGSNLLQSFLDTDVIVAEGSEDGKPPQLLCGKCRAPVDDTGVFNEEEYKKNAEAFTTLTTQLEEKEKKEQDLFVQNANLTEELAKVSEELRRLRESNNLHLQASTHAVEQARLSAEGKAKELQQQVDDLRERERKMLERERLRREDEYKQTEEMQEKHKKEMNDVIQARASLEQQVDSAKEEARRQRDAMREKMTALTTSLRKMATEHEVKERLFAERESHIKMLVSAKTSLEIQLRQTKAELALARETHKETVEAVKSLPTQVQSLRERLAEATAAMQASQEEMSAVATMAQEEFEGFSGMDITSESFDPERYIGGGVGGGSRAMKLVAHQQVKIKRLLEQVAKLESEYAALVIETEQGRAALAENQGLSEEVKNLREHIAKVDTECDALRAAMTQLVEEAPARAREKKPAKKIRIPSQRAGSSESNESSTGKTTDKLGATHQHENKQNETPQLSAISAHVVSTAANTTQAGAGDEEEDEDEPIVVLPEHDVRASAIRIQMKQGDVLFLADVLEGYLNGTKGQRSDPDDPDRDSPTDESIGALKLKIEVVTTDLQQLSQRYANQANALDSAKEEIASLTRKLEAEKSLSDHYKKQVESKSSDPSKRLPRSASNNDLSGVDDRSGRHTESGGDSNAGSGGGQVGGVYKRLAEAAENKVTELRKAIDACRAELATEQINHLKTSRQLHETTERLKHNIIQAASLRSMLDGLGLNADALSRAERIIANRKEKLTSTHSSFATSSSRSSSSSMYTADSDSYLNRVKQEFSNGIALKEAEKEIEKLKRNVETLEEKVEKLVAEKKVIEEHLEQLKRGPDTDVTSSSSLTPGDSSSSKKKDRFVQLSAQLAKVSLEHVHCPSAIAKLSEQLQETEKVLEGAKMDFARWKSQAEASLEMERSRAAYTANKLQALQDSQADGRVQLREEFERTLSVLRSQIRKQEKQIVTLVEQLDEAGIPMKTVTE